MFRSPNSAMRIDLYLLEILRYYNINRDLNKQEPKLYFCYDWFKTYDATNSLNLNILQYISDEVDACDESVISVKDYTTTPAEYYGAKDLALLKRINLVRTTKFNFLPIQIQQDLRNSFKLKNNQFIDLRSKNIKTTYENSKVIGEDPCLQIYPLIYRTA